jgi:2-polyprenyl-3-methyl-5-hydroxy-6-metoxy-1,4-benzoquinol methylase
MIKGGGSCVGGDPVMPLSTNVPFSGPAALAVGLERDGVARPTDANVGYRGQSRPEMLGFLPPNHGSMKILEVGCGDGAFGASIVSSSETWGIEPYGPAAAIASQRLFKVFSTTFEAAKSELPPHYFDIVVCNDVIEHMTDHEAFLSSVQDHMAPDAYLIGSIPNVRHYKNLFNLMIARDWNYEDSGVLDRTHFRFFTVRSLRRSLERAGFVVERLEGVTGGIYFAWDRWALAYSAFAYSLIVLSGGRARDIGYLQMGFRARSVTSSRSQK